MQSTVAFHNPLGVGRFDFFDEFLSFPHSKLCALSSAAHRPGAHRRRAQRRAGGAELKGVAHDGKGIDVCWGDGIVLGAPVQFALRGLISVVYSTTFFFS